MFTTDLNTVVNFVVFKVKSCKTVCPALLRSYQRACPALDVRLAKQNAA